MIAFAEQRGGISATTNRAMEMAKGDFVALLDHDDLLDPRALCEVAQLIGRNPDADMVYSDEDKIPEHSSRFYDPYFKPDWSPELLLSQMYTCHLGVYRRSLAKEIAFRTEYDEAQDYDFVLRFTERTGRVHHIPRILYHWRAGRGSAARSTGAKSRAEERAVAAVDEAIRRRGWRGRVELVHSGVRQVHLAPLRSPLISIVIPTRNGGRVLESCITSIRDRSDYRNYEIIVIDNGSDDPRTLKFLEDAGRSPNVAVKRIDIPFNHSKLCNSGAELARGELLVMLNDDTEVKTAGWLSEMAGYAMLPGVGAVGPLLLYPDGTVQHAGVILGIRGCAGHPFKRSDPHASTLFHRLQTTANYSAVTAACMMIEREKYWGVGGFDERMLSHFNDVDFCIRLLQGGLRQVYVPMAVLVHHEGATRRDEHTVGAEIMRIRDRWANVVDRDPYYNPYFTIDDESYRIQRVARY